jgi:hypothetical protein
MDPRQDLLWTFNYLYFWIVLFLVWKPLVEANEAPVPEMDPPGKSFHEVSAESSQKQKKP